MGKKLKVLVIEAIVSNTLQMVLTPILIKFGINPYFLMILFAVV